MSPATSKIEEVITCAKYDRAEPMPARVRAGRSACKRWRRAGRTQSACAAAVVGLTAALFASPVAAWECDDPDNMNNCCRARVPGDLGPPGACTNIACCEDVCACDPHCCDVEWDAACVDEAELLCRALCPGGFFCVDVPCQESCCSAHNLPGCNSPSCCVGVCGIDPNCCTVEWTCHCAEIAISICTGTGVCSPSDDPCDDGDACTRGECTGEFEDECQQTPVDCDDGNICTTENCIPSLGCIYAPFSRPCNDNDGCTENDWCVGGVCVGTPVDCDDGEQCTTEVCVGGACEYTNVPDSWVCGDDGNPCTIDECWSGVCNTPEPNGMPCDDNSACTFNDACQAGTCVGATAPQDCCSSGLLPGCDDPSCCGAVCALKPSCCTGVWDASCVLLAVENCSACFGDDCNGNLVSDQLDIAVGISADCNNNGVPDECELGDLYALDDGVQEAALGLTGAGDIAWLNEFTVVVGGEILVSLDVAIGKPGAGDTPAGEPIQLVVWDDPNDDGNPNDAVVLSTTASVTPGPGNTSYITYPITPTNVGSPGDRFFVGVFMNTDTHPVALDESSGSLGRSWIAGTTNASPLFPLDLNDLAGAETPVAVIDSLGFPGNWLVRATVISSGADCNNNGVPDECDVAAPALQLSIGLRETGVDVPVGSNGTTTGDIEWVDLDAQPLILDGQWRQYGWVLGTASYSPFTGDGVLDGDVGTFESIRLRSTGHPGPFTLWIDLFILNDNPPFFEYFEGYTEGQEVLFRQPPDFSGFTSAFLASGSSIGITNTGGDFGPGALRLDFGFVDSAPGNWLHLTTYDAAVHPNPALGFWQSAVVVFIKGEATPTSRDCNTNGIPDECEEDCNGNGVNDGCDVTGGTSPDCSSNGIPDECEDDCNGNSIPDGCDIAAGTSADCNSNAVPDACDDCNDTGTADVDDIAAGSSNDCNGNCVPDECDLVLLIEQAKLSESDPDALNQFGTSVALSGDTALIGDRWDNCAAGDFCGAAYIYRDTGSGWVEQAKLTVFDADTGDFFGTSVALSGDTALIGASGDDCTAGVDCGAAYLFVEPSGGWVDTTDATAKLTASDVSPVHDLFGTSVALSGETALIGASADECTAGVACGAAYVFVKPSGGWETTTETAELTASDADQLDSFGTSVALSGDTVLIGADSDKCFAGLNCGAAYVFVEPLGGWGSVPSPIDQEDAKLTALDADKADSFGGSVALSGETALIGASGDDCVAGNNCGAAYVFVKPLTVWVDMTEETAKLTASDADLVDTFGFSVALSGETALIGAPADDCVAGASCGAAYMFNKPPGGWNSVPSPIQEDAKLIASDANAFGKLGGSVALSGDRALIGATGPSGDDCTLGGDCGAAYAFSIAATDFNANDTLDACDIAAGTSFDCNDDGIPDEVQLVEETPLVSQPPDWVWGQLSDSGCDNCEGGADSFADNFALSARSVIRRLKLWGGYSLGNTPINPDAFTVIFHQDDGGGLPGSVLYTDTGAPDARAPTGNQVNGIDVYEYTLDFAPAITLDAGDYFVEIFNDTTGHLDDFIWFTGTIDPMVGTVGSAWAPNQAPGVTWYTFNDNFAFQLFADADTNGNGIPDECDAAGDCNGNGHWDGLDISADTSFDCNSNGIPDECDLAVGSSFDCDGNGAPDECGITTDCVHINEIRQNLSGVDTDEFFELAGDPGTALTGLTYLVIGDGPGTNGVIEEVIDLTGLSLPADGYFFAAEDGDTFGRSADLVTTLEFENNDNVTHLLVWGFTGLLGDDLDTDDDCTLDVTPWTAIADRIAFIMESNPPTTTECHYGPPTVGPDGVVVPGLGFRLPNFDGPWLIGAFDPSLANDTPGEPNVISFPDCNGNSVNDLFDIVGATSQDCNSNGAPDECDISGDTSVDCNVNAVPDECDIAGGTSTDLNTTGIPDECDVDCNNNGVFDGFDIAGTTSDDCTTNGIPDECEDDCNSNGIADSCDIAAGTAEDCNSLPVLSNGVPDECDIAAGATDENGNGVPDICEDCNTNGIPDVVDIFFTTSEDCNGNWFPDECDLSAGTSADCNANDEPDDCDVATGASPDCNTNGVPDECDISSETSADCNINTIPDECDVATGASPDCNSNGVPDECDISSETSADCNINTVPDECDLVAGTSTDLSGNGVPDECDPDCNANGVPDHLDISGDTSTDLNDDGVPDECDPDCNTNGVSDALDIFGGTSLDCDNNGVPDECQPDTDCNSNGVADYCDIAGDTSLDCNNNNVPDSCDLAAGQPDGNANGVLDFCEDCDSNGTPDFIDLFISPWKDCNGNRFLDECDLAAGTSADCNANDTPDDCEPLGDCFTSSAEPGCDDPACCDTVCVVDPSCCTTQWTEICADKALALCVLTPGDCNGDAVVDLADVVAFVACLGGPDTVITPGCECADIDPDGSGDARDYAALQRLFFP